LPMHDGGPDATMTTDPVNGANADEKDEEAEFAISMAAMLRTAARAADEFEVSCRELAGRFALRRREASLLADCWRVLFERSASPFPESA
jgi:hypothetical protein